MTIIHMDPDHLKNTIHQFKKTSNQFEHSLEKIKQIDVKIQMNWSGEKATESFTRELQKNFSQLSVLCQDLQKLDQLLNHEVNQWLEEDAKFSEVNTGVIHPVNETGINSPVLTVAELQKRMCGSLFGKDLDRCLSIWGSPPTNAEQLAYMIQSLPESMPIVIMQIGENEYLVLLRGSTTNLQEGANLGSAFEAMFGNSSYQNNVIEALNKANLPEGSQLHFAGHSQGGMIGQNLAVDPRINRSYDIKSVTSYGSPRTLLSRSLEFLSPDVDFVCFEGQKDWIADLDGLVKDIDEMILGFDISFRNEQVHNIFDSSKFNFRDPVEHHRIYDDPGLLSDYDIPFQAKTWSAVSQEKARISTPGPVIFAGFKWLYDDMRMVVEGTNDALNFVMDGLKNTGVI